MAGQAIRQWSGSPFARKVFEELKRCATEGSTTVYRDLAERVGGVGANPQSVFPALNYIRDNVCLPHNLPWLWVLAVNDTGKPGDGAWRSTKIVSPDEKQWADILRLVYAYDWSDVGIEDDKQTGRPGKGETGSTGTTFKAPDGERKWQDGAD